MLSTFHLPGQCRPLRREQCILICEAEGADGSEQNTAQTENIGAKTLHILSHIQLIRNTLPWK
jgi:hypothetical protein